MQKKKNGLGVIDMSSVENIPDFKMTQGEKKKQLNTIKAIIILIGWINLANLLGKKEN